MSMAPYLLGLTPEAALVEVAAGATVVPVAGVDTVDDEDWTTAVVAAVEVGPTDVVVTAVGASPMMIGVAEEVATEDTTTEVKVEEWVVLLPLASVLVEATTEVEVCVVAVGAAELDELDTGWTPDPPASPSDLMLS